MIPGSNLLNRALKIIGRQQFQYYAFFSRAQNRIGQDIATYAAPQNLSGSVQPVPRNVFQQYGLDFQRNYLMFFLSENVIDIRRDVSGDLMNFGGNTYQCISKTDWFPMDGWVSILCVQIDNTALVSAIVPPANDDYATGEFLDFTLTYNFPVTVDGAPVIDIAPIGAGTIGGDAVYLSGSGTNTLAFRYEVQVDDTAPAGIAITSPVDLPEGAAIAYGSVGANSSFVVPDLSGVTINVG